MTRQDAIEIIKGIKEKYDTSYEDALNIAIQDIEIMDMKDKMAKESEC